MGNRKPTEFLLELRRLLADESIKFLVKRVFLRSSPDHVRKSITRGNNRSLDDLAEAADHAYEHAAKANMIAKVEEEKEVQAVRKDFPNQQWKAVANGQRQRNEPLGSRSNVPQTTPANQRM